VPTPTGGPLKPSFWLEWDFPAQAHYAKDRGPAELRSDHRLRIQILRGEFTNAGLALAS
jgi:hypothetical protein